MFAHLGEARVNAAHSLNMVRPTHRARVCVCTKHASNAQNVVRILPRTPSNAHTNRHQITELHGRDACARIQFARLGHELEHARGHLILCGFFFFHRVLLCPLVGFPFGCACVFAQPRIGPSSKMHARYTIRPNHFRSIECVLFITL